MSSPEDAQEVEASLGTARIIVREALDQVRRNLVDLREERARVRKRIHHLRRLEKGLSSFGIAPPQEGQLRVEPAQPVSTQNDQHGIAQPQMIPVSARRKSGNPELRRACRIALMETTEPEMAWQIVERIKRRGAFSFEAKSNPPAAVIDELVGMVMEGEAFRNGNDGWGWRRDGARLGSK